MTAEETTCLNSGGDAPAFPPSAASSLAEQKAWALLERVRIYRSAWALVEASLAMPIDMGQCGHAVGTLALPSMGMRSSGAAAW